MNDFSAGQEVLWTTEDGKAFTSSIRMINIVKSGVPANVMMIISTHMMRYLYTLVLVQNVKKEGILSDIPF